MSKISALFLCLAAPVALASCASATVVHGEVGRDKLFPYGTYKHEVKLVLPAHGEAPEKKFEFSGIVQLKPDAVHVVVFSFLGTTAFKIDEDLKTGEIRTAIYVAQMKKFEPRLKEYYGILRELLIAGATPPVDGARLRWVKTDDQGRPIEMRTVGLEKNAIFKLLDFDANRIPARFLIEHPGFSVEVRVKSYEI
jgi:hypothetical protein